MNKTQQPDFYRINAARGLIEHLDGVARGIEPLAAQERAAALMEARNGMDVLASQHAENALSYRARISVMYETIALLETVFGL